MKMSNEVSVRERSIYDLDISQDECNELTKGMEISLIRQRAAYFDRYAIMLKGKYLDTSFAFTDQRYYDIQEKFEGNILILGLGFGCSIMEALNSKKVKNVTVYEINKEVIELFFKMRPQYKNNDRLEIICKDAMKIKATKFKHVFINRHHLSDPKDYDQYREDMSILQEKFKDSQTHFIKVK